MKKNSLPSPADISEFNIVNRYELLALICRSSARITVDSRDIPQTEANVLINSPECSGMLLKDANLICRFGDRHVDLVSPDAFDAVVIHYARTHHPEALVMFSFG